MNKCMLSLLAGVIVITVFLPIGCMEPKSKDDYKRLYLQGFEHIQKRESGLSLSEWAQRQLSLVDEGSAQYQALQDIITEFGPKKIKIQLTDHDQVIQIDMDMMPWMRTLNQFAEDLGEAAVSESVIPIQLSMNTFTTLQSLLNELSEIGDLSQESVESLANNELFQKFTLEDILSLIEAINYLDVVLIDKDKKEHGSLLNVICHVLVAKMVDMQTLETVMSYPMLPEIANIITYYILEDKHILEELCKLSANKGKKRILGETHFKAHHLTSFWRYITMNNQGDVAFVVRAGGAHFGLYVFSTQKDQIIQMPYVTAGQSHQAACAISADGRFVAYLVEHIPSKIVLYVVDLQTGDIQQKDMVNVEFPCNLTFCSDNTCILIGTNNTIFKYSRVLNDVESAPYITFQDSSKKITALDILAIGKKEYLYVVYGKPPSIQMQHALYDMSGRRWVDEDTIPENIVLNDDRFTFENVMKAIGIEATTSESQLLELLGIADQPMDLVVQNRQAYQLFLKLDDTKQCLITVIGSFVKTLIENFNKKTFLYNDALYLLALHFNNSDRKQVGAVLALFKQKGFAISPEARLSGTIRNRSITDLEVVEVFTLEGDNLGPLVVEPAIITFSEETSSEESAPTLEESVDAENSSEEEDNE